MALRSTIPSNSFKFSKSKPVKPEDIIFFDSVSKGEFEIICRNSPSQPDTSDLELDIVYTDDIFRKIVEILSGEKKVEHIFLIRDLTTFSIWTLIADTDKESRRALYAKELEVIRFFSPVEFHFDFHIVYPEDTEELVSSGVRVIYSKK